MTQSAKSALGDTLAKRVQILRESCGLSQSKLAELANLPLSQVEDIERGLELFLSASVRQKLARVLKIKGSTLQAVEKAPEHVEPRLSASAREQYIDEIIHYPNRSYYCPFCKATLDVRLFHRKDLEDNPLVEVKANCTQCLFRL